MQSGNVSRQDTHEATPLLTYLIYLYVDYAG